MIENIDVLKPSNYLGTKPADADGDSDNNEDEPLTGRERYIVIQ